jgi:adenine deaminase
VDDLIGRLPKAELHLHLEGSLEPGLMLELARRNDIALPWTSVADVRAAYEFTGLQAFLDLYYAGSRVLVTRRDFHDLTAAYLRRARADNVVHAEVFLGPQSFTERGTPIADVLDGALSAFDVAGDVTGGLIVSAQRHRTEAAAFELLDAVAPWGDRIVGFGLGGAEVGNPPGKFARWFAECRSQGFRTTAHAGEEGPAAYVREAVEVCGVDRIDHGIACLADPELVGVLRERQLPLTVCPLSNLRLKVVPDLARHPLRRMLAAGLLVTVNSDDPAYFGGYANDNHRALGLTDEEVRTVVDNGFRAAFSAGGRT